MKRLGSISLLQVHRSPVKTKYVGYDPAPLLTVDEAAIGPDGMLGHHDGGWVVDFHSRIHPAGRGGGGRALSIGFTSHHEAISARYGERVPGEVGENIVVQTPEMITMDDLVGTMVLRTEEGDIRLRDAQVAKPCREFASYLLGLPEIADRSDLSADLEFLEDGMRGFVFGVDDVGGWVTVRVGDEVFVDPV